ncbi:MAG: DUF1834 family protein [Verrucomicrobia bacterium]|nr:DUF1834 family protein [Verrucomicrobiota bacterium]
MNPLLQCEGAIIAELETARRPDDASQELWNLVDTYAGERDEVFAAMVARTSPAAFVQLFSCNNTAKLTEKLGRHGRRTYAPVPEDMMDVTWSIFVCAKSLRNPRELRRGAVGVVGIYELLDGMLDLQNQNGTLPGRIRNRKLLADWDVFFLQGYELVGQTQTACVFEVQFRTRYQILNAMPKPGGVDGGIFGPTPSGKLDGGRF